MYVALDMISALNVGDSTGNRMSGGSERAAGHRSLATRPDSLEEHVQHLRGRGAEADDLIGIYAALSAL
jgi:hypothetical protein